jgi:hypothetical protein
MDVQTMATLIREGGRLVTEVLQVFGRQPATVQEKPVIDLPQEKPDPLPPPPPSTPKVTTEQTINHQKRELVKELLLLEGHLQQSCKIDGIACDCCTKHPITIEGLAQETTGMTTDPVFKDLASWAKSIADITTEEASASGEYDERYPELAIKAREFRKAIMPTEKEV